MTLLLWLIHDLLSNFSQQNLYPKILSNEQGEQEKECILILDKMPLQFIAKDQL